MIGTTSGARIAPVTPETCRPDIAEMLAAGQDVTGGASNVNGTLARHPGLFKRYAPFGAKLLAAGRLPARDREILILRTAWWCECGYELVHHSRIAAEVGLSAPTIAALKRSVRLTDALTEFDRVLIGAVSLLLSCWQLDEETVEKLRSSYDDEQIIELIMLVGNYAMLAGLLKSLDVSLED